MKRGIIYCATEGRVDTSSRLSFIRECEISARRVKELHSDLNITLFTTSEDYDTHTCFDKVIKIDKNFIGVFPSENSYLLKNIAFISSPYEHTIFLDSDTYIINDGEQVLYELFTETEDYDFCATIEPAMIRHTFNTGVVSFKKQYDFLFEWFKLSGTETKTDQASLEKILLPNSLINDYKLKIKTLNQKWNWRDRKINGRVSDTKNINKKGLHKHQIKILHNRWRLQKMGILK
mgnify:FL=1